MIAVFLNNIYILLVKINKKLLTLKAFQRSFSMLIWYKYFGISEEILLILLLLGVSLILLLSGDLRVLLSEDPDLPLVPLPDGSWVFFILHEFLKFFK